jgi:DMSO/TMAO reductase YedYZ molybdopterin-dependent catalytic subunit
LVTATGIVVLWPVLDSNYLGLASPWARTTTALGLGLDVAAFAVTLAIVHDRLGTGAPAPAPEARPPARRALVRTRPSTEEDATAGPRFGRRAVLAGGVGLLAAAASAGMADVLYRRATFGAFGYDGLMVRGPHTQPITPNDEFYCVTKNLIDPSVSASVWRLRISGLVARPMELDLDGLRALPAVTQLQTLECISNGIGAGLMSNAEWVGVPMPMLLAAARPTSSVRRVVMRGADGFVHTVSMDRAMDPTTIVAFTMNGQPLPRRHGYPARALVPGAYGEVSVKWIESIELTDAPVQGYYERQGWRPYDVQTVSRFDRPSSDQTISLTRTPAVSVGGVAFAGDRGISRVEWSDDGGATWSLGRITYAPSRLTWSLWEASWSPSAPGPYRLVVRAVDGTGVTQPAERRGVVPSGAAGWHAINVTVRA